MKKFLILLLLPSLAGAAEVTVNWTLPTKDVNGANLTGASALTSVQVFLATSTIPNTSTMQPTVTLTPSATTTTQTFSASPGQTIFARVKACNSGGCSAFSGEGSKLIPVSAPDVPTNITITLSLQ